MGSLTGGSSAERWLDLHVHVCDKGADGVVRGKILNDLMAVLDACDADLRFVVSPDGHWLDEIRDEPGGARRACRFIYELVREAPGRLFGACMVNPNFLDDSLRAMEDCFERWGFVLFGEMLQYMFGFSMDGEAAERTVRQATEYGVPTQVHISTSHSRTHPSSFGREQMAELLLLAERTPESRYILAHAVGGMHGQRAVFDEYADMVEERFGGWAENFWVEIAQFHTPALRSALRRVPHNRLVAGTDWTSRVGPPFLPYGSVFGLKEGEPNPFPPSVEALARFLREAGAEEDSVRAIAWGNAAELLGIG